MLGLAAIACSREEERDAVGLFSKSVSIEAQLAELAKAGLVVNPGVVEADLTTFHSRAEMEKKPYAGLVEVLGIELEREPFTPICDRLWMCDFERIEDHGAYREVVERLERMTGGALQLSGIADYVVIDEEKAWVEFDRGGQRTHWDLRIQDDWLDEQVLRRYAALLATSGSPIRLYINETDYGQTAFLGAFTAEEKAAFEKLSPIRLPPMPLPSSD